MASVRRVLPAILSLLAGCAAQAEGPPQVLATHPACLVSGDQIVNIELEHATTLRQRQLGLMERPELPADRGMLFLYEQPRSADSGFWMYRTLIPLDIAWLDQDGVIVAVDTMVPCQTRSPRDCPTWAPGVAHRHVLELNAGFLQSRSIGVGDRLLFGDQQGGCQRSQ